MNGFLVNLARRSAGLPATMIQTPPPWQFGPGISGHGEEVTETSETVGDFTMTESVAVDHPASQAPWPTSAAAEPGEPSLGVAIQHTPSIQRFSGPEPATAGQASAAEPAAVPRTPATPMELSQRSGATVPPYPTAYVDSTETAVERDLAPPSAVIDPLEAASQSTHHASNPSFASAREIESPPQQQSIAVPAFSPVQPPSTPQPQHPMVLPVPTIRPALTAFPIALDLPRVPANSVVAPDAQLPIHVRIGRVEVRATPASQPPPARPSAPAALGFDAYYRLRTYRS